MGCLGMKSMGMLVALLLAIASAASAAEIHCDICGMTIPDHAKNHLLLKTGAADAKQLHVCSLSCVRKARKHDSTLTQSAIADFNHSDSMLPGEKAFVLIQSQKIRADMGEMAMPPFAAGFRTRREAEAAREKYGDGAVVEGLENAFK